jgi:O-antigen ligase
MVAFLAAAGIVGYLAFVGGGFLPLDYGRAGFVAWVGIALMVLGGLIPASRLAPRQRLPLVLFALLIAWIFAGLLWTDSIERTVDDLDRLALVGAVLVLAGFGLTRRTWRSAAAGLSLATIGIATFAAASRLFPDLVVEASRASSIAGGRLAYPIEYWNAMAGVCAMAVCAGVGWGAHAASSRVRGLALASVPASGLALYLTYSRGGLLALACGLTCLVALSRDSRSTAAIAFMGLAGAATAVLSARSQDAIASGSGGQGGWLVVLALLLAGLACWAYAMRRQPSPSARKGRGLATRRLSEAVALGLGLVVLGLAGAALVEGGSERPAPGADEASLDPSTRLISLETNRANLWESAVEAFAEHPVNGLGSGSYGLWLARDPETRAVAADAHSLPLETAAELGLPGLFLLCGFFWFLARAAWGVRGSMEHERDHGIWALLLSIFSVFAVQSLVDWVWEVSVVAVVGVASLSIAAAAAGRERTRRRVPAARRGLALAACVAVAAAQVPGLIAAERTDLSERALASGATGLARDTAEDAVAAAPWSASAYAQLSEAALAQRDLGDAEEAAAEAIRLEPKNWRHALLAARVAATIGDDKKARSALRLVADLRPGAAGLARAAARDPQSLAAPGVP